MEPIGQDIFQPRHSRPTALLILEDDTVLAGQGFGAEAHNVGEVCFNTSMTGYQEILTDPSYAGQIITFTFPHIGNVGANPVDIESLSPAALGLITAQLPSKPSNYRSTSSLDAWLKSVNLPGIAGIDTRALTHRIREQGAPKGILAHAADGVFDMEQLRAKLAAWPGLKGMELASTVSTDDTYDWDQGAWEAVSDRYADSTDKKFHVVALDYGCKLNILRCLVDIGCSVTLAPATSRAEDILSMRPDGIFLSNGPGDPAATSAYTSDEIRRLAASGIPMFGICIGHQLIAEAFGARTYKMVCGHRGANHPVKDMETGMIEITTQNHGFAVGSDDLPSDLTVTHISLFDGSIEGLRHNELPIFSVQYHPESSSGPHDSRHLFGRFARLMEWHSQTRSSHAKA